VVGSYGRLRSGDKFDGVSGAVVPIDRGAIGGSWNVHIAMTDRAHAGTGHRLTWLVPDLRSGHKRNNSFARAAKSAAERHLHLVTDQRYVGSGVSEPQLPTWQMPIS